MLLFQFLIVSISYGVFLVGMKLSSLIAPFFRGRNPRFRPPLVFLLHENTGNPHGVFLQFGPTKHGDVT